MNDKLMKMKVLVLVAIALCSFASVTKATKQQPEQLLIGEETFWMYTLPIEKDSVLSRELQKRLSGRISTGLYRGYVGTWRLEEGKLILEKVVEMSENGGYQEVDISGIFDAYRESGRIVARWFTGTILARGGKYLYWDNDRYEHEILYSLRKGEVKREKRMYNTFQAGSNRNYHGTMNMLFNGNGMVWEGDSILKVEIYPNPDGTVNRVSVWSERDAKKRSRISSERLRAKVERLRKKRNWWEAESRFWARNVSGIKKKRYSRHHPYTREVMACAELMEKWDVLTLDGKIQPARVSIAWGENKGRNWSFDILGKNEQDSLVMEGDTYRVDTYLLQQNPDLITRLRSRLKGAFMEKQPRGYLARWRIADDRLWLVGIRNACTGEVIPLSVLNPGNNGEPLEASWYTGTFEIAKGEVLGQCYPLSRAEKREVVCEVVRGRVVRQSVYDNYIQSGDSVAYNHFIQVIRSHDWDSYPELKGRSLHGRLIVCPRADGVADSIKRIYLYINGGVGTRYHREIDNPSDPWIELVRRAAERVTRWEVCCIQGKVEPVEVWFTLKELTCDIPEGKQVGDTLTGKHAKYKLYADDSGVFSVLQNLVNRDTVNLRLVDPKGTIRPSTVLACFNELFTKIVGEFLTLSEKAIYKKAGGDIIVACRLKEGKIEELSFWWFKMLPFPEDDPEMQGEMGRAIVEKYKMLRRIPVDRFLEIEKALKERVDFSGLEWIEKEGIYLQMSVDSCYMD